ncbi:HAD-IIB family hydrolase [Levilactobacillus wangkuiensis]|uniref:HAD-IIB family hydrolase n=1 Tax=Levilactobacillus wangkuiensis TaxID=2799566 RepID=UPI001943F2A3|nr:HAD family hydrolase [Levilactobacillus wangkuiensis]
MKTFVFDVDGTLSFDGQTIAAEILASIQALVERGHRIIFASARPIRDLMPIIPGFKHVQLIGANGALVVQNGRVEVVAPIQTADFHRLRGVIAQANLDYVVDGRWDYAARVTPTHPLAQRIDPAHLAQRVSLGEITTAVKVVLLGLPPRQATDLSRTLAARKGLAVVSYAGEGNLDITAQDINKATALQHLGVTDYIAFGNDQNDLEMLAGARTIVWVNSKTQLAHLGQLASVTCQPTSQAVATQIARLA